MLTYDSVNKVYYILINVICNLNSFSILISDTFDNMNKEYKHLFNFDSDNLTKTKNYFKMLIDNKDKENQKFNFDIFMNY